MTNGVTGKNHPDEPTRPLDDGEWFWTREASEQTAQQPEPTRVIPLTEQTQVLAAADDTRMLPIAPGEPVAPGAPGAQPPSWAPPAGQPVAATLPPSAPRRQGGARALLAVFTASLLTGMAVLQAPALARTAERLPGGQPTSQPEPTQLEPTQLDPTQLEPGGGQDQQDTAPEQSTGGSQGSVSSSQGKGVVLIEATTSSGRSAGTGMVIADDGYVLTNYHVVQTSTALRVQVASSQKTYQATVVGHDASNDVALLKLEGAQGLDTVTLDDDQLSTGDAVTAVGNANGQGHLSAAAGRVTDMSSSITVSNETSAGGKEELSDVIKTTAGAQPGDSGGPMLDEEGEVVGMTTAGQQASSGIRTQNSTIASYAVPIERAMGIIDQIRSGNESGTVKIGPKAYLGVSVQTLDDGSISVASVVSGGPADTAGLSRGDIVTSLDQTSITSHTALSEVLAAKEPGDRVTMTWLDASSGARRSAEVTLGSSPLN